MHSISKDLELIFEDMDAQYKLISEWYGFDCNGCEDNCCKTNFYHHTLLEYWYLAKGFSKIPTRQQRSIEEKAISNNRRLLKGLVLKSMCPLNIETKCIIYKYRPMICRLHGVPHKIQYATGSTKIGQGCYKFQFLGTKTSSTPKQLDRTHLYKKLADLELKARKMFRFSKRIKMTISEIIVKRYYLDEIFGGK